MFRGLVGRDIYRPGSLLLPTIVPMVPGRPASSRSETSESSICGSSVILLAGWQYTYQGLESSTSTQFQLCGYWRGTGAARRVEVESPGGPAPVIRPWLVRRGGGGGR